MKINKVTITGADDLVNIDDLIDLQDKYPFVECGILFSMPREGSARYPKREWVEKTEHLHTSAHLCGFYARQVIEQGEMNFITLLPVNKIQLNYNFDKTTKWKIEELKCLLLNHPEISVIFQANEANKAQIKILDKLQFPNLNFLYDSSGGRGTEIQEIKSPFKDRYTGYSGGITPDNIESICHLITDHPNTQEVWIDMESGIRTDNKFDLEKVEKVLSICKNYI